MVNDHGHVKISRKAYLPVEKGGDPWWNKPRTFSEWEAWEYLIQAAAWAPHTWALRSGAMLEIDRGETRPLAVRFLMNAWGWGSVKRVHSFLQQCIDADRIRKQQETRDGNTYLLVNYEVYQSGGNAEETQVVTERKRKGNKREAGKAKLSIHQTRVREDEDVDPEHLIDLVIRLANRGMADNPEIDDQFNPIPIGHGSSRQAAADWLAAGISFETIREVVYERARQYRPTGRYRQIGSLSYFATAVEEEHERRAALALDAPSSGDETTIEGWTAKLPPDVREWAEATDELLREAEQAGGAAARWAEQTEAHLRKLHAEDKAFTRSSRTDQHAHIRIRLLNAFAQQYGHEPMPNSRRLAGGAR